MYRDTGASDSTIQQGTSFPNARFGWLDTWGLLFNVPRLNNEADSKYAVRILYTITAGAGTPVGIATWIYIVWGLTVTVQESPPAVGYNITFQQLLSGTQLLNVLQSLVRIRPAGIPFTLSFPENGLYLNTINFLNSVNVTGAYLTDPNGTEVVGLSAGTNNAEPVLPGIFLTDPVLNSIPS
jgi:hypothetical protein